MEKASTFFNYCCSLLGIVLTKGSPYKKSSVSYEIHKTQSFIVAIYREISVKEKLLLNTPDVSN